MALVNEALMKLAADAVKNAVMTVDYNGYGAANASGQLYNSIQSVPTDRGFDVVATGPAVKYVGTLRYGRRPGTTPPVSAILKWMDVKGVATDVTGSKRTGVAWAIAKKIGKEGNVVTRNNLAPTVIWNDAVDQITEAVAAQMAGAIIEAV